MDTGVNYVHTALNAHTWIIPNRTVPGIGSGIQAFHDYGRLDTDSSGNSVYGDDYMTARTCRGMARWSPVVLWQTPPRKKALLRLQDTG
jgi:hypothetical protein